MASAAKKRRLANLRLAIYIKRAPNKRKNAAAAVHTQILPTADVERSHRLFGARRRRIALFAQKKSAARHDCRQLSPSRRRSFSTQRRKCRRNAGGRCAQKKSKQFFELEDR